MQKLKKRLNLKNSKKKKKLKKERKNKKKKLKKPPTNQTKKEENLKIFLNGIIYMGKYFFFKNFINYN